MTFRYPYRKISIMVTKREYLIQRGLAKPGPGRPSRAAKQAIDDAINAGVKFDDPSGKTVVVVSTDENGNEVKTTKRIADVPEVPDPRTDRPAGMYTFKNPDGSTFKRLHTNACAKCSISFQWCVCVSGPFQFPYPYASGDVYATVDRVPARQVIPTDNVPEKPVRRRPRKGKSQVAA